MKYLVFILLFIASFTAKAQQQQNLGNANTTILVPGTLQSRIIKFDSIRSKGSIVSQKIAGLGFAVLGNSIMNYTGSTDTLHSAYYLLNQQANLFYGLVGHNYSQSGAIITAYSQIPTRSSINGAFIFLYFGINEAAASMANATFATNCRIMADSCVARGWSYSQIIFCGISGNDFGYLSTTPFHRPYNRTMDSIAQVIGGTYVDSYEGMLSPAYNYITKGILHPNNDGHEYIAHAMLGGFRSTYDLSLGQRLVVDSFSQLDRLILKSSYFVSNGLVLGRDSATSRVGAIWGLPSGMATLGLFYLGNGFIQRGSVTPTSGTPDSTLDIFIRYNAKIWSYATGTAYANIQLNNASGNSTYTNSFASGTLTISMGGTNYVFSQLAIASPGPINFTQIGAINKTQGGATDVMDNSTNGVGIWVFKKTYNQHAFSWETNNGGTNGTSTPSMALSINGSFTLNPGGAATGAELAENKSSGLTFISTTKGSVPFPVMTDAQGRAIVGGFILTGSTAGLTITTAGSGYVNGSYFSVPLTGGTGSGALSTINVVGGVVISYNVTTAGTGYKRGDVLSASNTNLGGSGSGLQLTVTGTNTEGLGWYNSTTHKYNFNDGNTIRTIPDSASLRISHTIFAPTTGGTVSLVNNQYNIINPAGTLAALTVNLPSSPSNNDVVYIKYTQAITIVTYGNGTVVDGITAPSAGGLVMLTYDAGTTSWY